MHDVARRPELHHQTITAMHVSELAMSVSSGPTKFET
jgi:hypothetical protein